MPSKAVDENTYPFRKLKGTTMYIIVPIALCVCDYMRKGWLLRMPLNVFIEKLVFHVLFFNDELTTIRVFGAF